jgi:hypothetical protein
MAEREPDYAEHLEAIEKIARLNLPEEDGIPLESEMHYTLPWMLRLSIQAHWEGRTDFYIGCNMFLYYAYEQAEEIDPSGAPTAQGARALQGTRPVSGARRRGRLAPAPLLGSVAARRDATPT